MNCHNLLVLLVGKYTYCFFKATGNDKTTDCTTYGLATKDQ